MFSSSSHRERSLPVSAGPSGVGLFLVLVVQCELHKEHLKSFKSVTSQRMACHQAELKPFRAIGTDKQPLDEMEYLHE